jgi:hypothetical protein
MTDDSFLIALPLAIIAWLLSACSKKIVWHSLRHSFATALDSKHLGRANEPSRTQTHKCIKKPTLREADYVSFPLAMASFHQRVIAVSVRDLQFGNLIPSGCRRDKRREDSRWNRRNYPHKSLFLPK